MLKYFNYDIVFQEVPDEVTLAINISNCPNHCKGCHSPWLQEDKGEILNKESLITIVKKYINDITCVCFMGGDNDVVSVEDLSNVIHSTFQDKKTAWYSGKESLPNNISINSFDYIKLGGYKQEYGSLKSKTTNQRLYKIDRINSNKEDITYRFWKK